MREEAAHLREETVTSREWVNYAANTGHAQRKEAVELREDAVCLREDAAHLREDTATLRERQIRAVEDMVGTGLDHPQSIMRQANSELIVSVIEAQKLAEQIETAKTRLHYLAHHDVLTGLPNRMLLQDRLNQSIELARRQGRRFAVYSWTWIASNKSMTPWGTQLATNYCSRWRNAWQNVCVLRIPSAAWVATNS